MIGFYIPIIIRLPRELSIKVFQNQSMYKYRK